jgi:hypothetical protein
MQRTAAGSELLSASREVDRVVAVPSIGRTATREHKPTSAQLTQMVRDQALPLAEELRQLPHGPITRHQLLQQPPPNRMRNQLQEGRRIARTGRRAQRRFHNDERTPAGAVQSIQIDAIGRTRDTNGHGELKRLGL